MIFLPFLIFLSLIKSLFPSQKKYISDYYNSIFGLENYNYIEEAQNSIYDCLTYYINISYLDESDFLGFGICFFNTTKYNIDETKAFISVMIQNLPTIYDLDKNNDLYIIYKILNESQNNGLIDEMFELLENN